MVLTQFLSLLKVLIPASLLQAGFATDENKCLHQEDKHSYGTEGQSASIPCNHNYAVPVGIRKDLTACMNTSPDAERESINWRNRRKLNWNDFKATPVTNAPNAALTSTSILINFGYDDKSLSYTIKCVFYPQKSWTKVSSPHILAHEQGHFDISQLFTRKLHKALGEYRFSAGTVDRDVQKIYNQISLDQAKFQQLYDNETNYSRNTEVQKKWQARIEAELGELDTFSKYPQ